MPAPEQLLNKLLTYFLRRGVANLSLRPLAAATGTSARMLVHHFGSKERLITAVMDQVRARLQDSFERLAGQAHKTKPGEMMLEFWKLATTKKYEPYLRLLFEVQILALQNPKRYERYLIDTSTTWSRLLRNALPPGAHNAAMATLCISVVDGLLLEYLSTGDLRRTSRALELFLALLGDRNPSERHSGLSREKRR